MAGRSRKVVLISGLWLHDDRNGKGQTALLKPMPQLRFELDSSMIRALFEQWFEHDSTRYENDSTKWAATIRKQIGNSVSIAEALPYRISISRSISDMEVPQSIETRDFFANIISLEVWRISRSAVVLWRTACQRRTLHDVIT